MRLGSGVRDAMRLTVSANGDAGILAIACVVSAYGAVGTGGGLLVPVGFVACVGPTDISRVVVTPGVGENTMVGVLVAADVGAMAVFALVGDMAIAIVAVGNGTPPPPIMGGGGARVRVALGVTVRVCVASGAAQI